MPSLSVLSWPFVVHFFTLQICPRDAWVKASEELVGRSALDLGRAAAERSPESVPLPINQEISGGYIPLIQRANPEDAGEQSADYSSAGKGLRAGVSILEDFGRHFPSWIPHFKSTDYLTDVRLENRIRLENQVASLNVALKKCFDPVLDSRFTTPGPSWKEGPKQPHNIALDVRVPKSAAEEFIRAWRTTNELLKSENECLSRSMMLETLGDLLLRFLTESLKDPLAAPEWLTDFLNNQEGKHLIINRISNTIKNSPKFLSPGDVKTYVNKTVSLQNIWRLLHQLTPLNWGMVEFEFLKYQIQAFPLLAAKNAQDESGSIWEEFFEVASPEKGLLHELATSNASLKVVSLMTRLINIRLASSSVDFLTLNELRLRYHIYHFIKIYLGRFVETEFLTQLEATPGYQKLWIVADFFELSFETMALEMVADLWIEKLKDIHRDLSHKKRDICELLGMLNGSVDVALNLGSNFELITESAGGTRSEEAKAPIASGQFNNLEGFLESVKPTAVVRSSVLRESPTPEARGNSAPRPTSRFRHVTPISNQLFLNWRRHLASRVSQISSGSSLPGIRLEAVTWASDCASLVKIKDNAKQTMEFLSGKVEGQVKQILSAEHRFDPKIAGSSSVQPHPLSGTKRSFPGGTDASEQAPKSPALSLQSGDLVRPRSQEPNVAETPSSHARGDPASFSGTIAKPSRQFYDFKQLEMTNRLEELVGKRSAIPLENYETAKVIFPSKLDGICNTIFSSIRGYFTKFDYSSDKERESRIAMLAHIQEVFKLADAEAGTALVQKSNLSKSQPK